MIISNKQPYLIFVIFLHKQNFWRIKFTPKKRVNYDKIHSKLPIFRVKYVKNLHQPKKFTRAPLVALMTNMRYVMMSSMMMMLSSMMMIRRPHMCLVIPKSKLRSRCFAALSNSTLSLARRGSENIFGDFK